MTASLSKGEFPVMTGVFESPLAHDTVDSKQTSNKHTSDVQGDDNRANESRFSGSDTLDTSSESNDSCLYQNLRGSTLGAPNSNPVLTAHPFENSFDHHSTSSERKNEESAKATTTTKTLNNSASTEQRGEESTSHPFERTNKNLPRGSSSSTDQSIVRPHQRESNIAEPPFHSSRSQSITIPSALSATANIWKSSKTTTLLEQARNSAGQSQPSWSMGYDANTNESARTRASGSKMDSPSTPVRDNKAEDDGYSVDDSLNSSGLSSPAMPPVHFGESASRNVTPLLLPPLMGTPTTVGTAPSTDEESTGGEGMLSPPWEKLTLRLDEAYGFGPSPGPVMHRHEPRGQQQQQQQQQYHRRSSSWGAGAVPGQRDAVQQFANQMVHPSPDRQYQSGRGQQQAWGQQHAMAPAGYPIPHGPMWEAHHGRASQSRVASFRRADSDTTGRYPPQHIPAPPYGDPRSMHGAQSPHFHQMNVEGGGRGYRHPGVGSYHGQQKMGYAGRPGTQTPPRPQHHGQSPARANPSSPGDSGSPGGPSSPGGQRSQAEVLKTLLRKKACLYEPGTSRAVALMTWLVGRELALEYGYFSRQQLQAGVHSCVAEKIDSGTITRTKVNRCMQIILNSCFHYIIPRPDGSEESGEAFRDGFAAAVQDDADLLQSLNAPWNDLDADHDAIMEAASEGEEKQVQKSITSPTSSPRITSTPSDEDSISKRAVLLCFNENVRSAQDVFRCHNEFIRDTANASNLHLSAQEWRVFFGKESTVSLSGSPRGVATSEASWRETAASRPDFFGEMKSDELAKFRTTWCAKRYDHDHDLCGFAHVEVNGGWLRRNPSEVTYSDKLCPHIKQVSDKRIGPGQFAVNSCGEGAGCRMAHSREEVLYHPQRYKQNECPYQTVHTITCPLAESCPHHHRTDSMRYQARRRGSGDGRPGQRQSFGRQGSSSKLGVSPDGPPMLYVNPAPVSKFEEHLILPGLQSLFRRHCAVTQAYLSDEEETCHYTPFGGGGFTVSNEETTMPSHGLPPARSE